MSILNNSLLLGADAAAGGYQISRSVRFNSSDSAYCSRTPAVAGDRQKWTWAGWVKRSTISDSVPVHIFSAGTSGASNVDFFGIETDNTIRFGSYDGAAFVFQYVTTQVFRDPSAWYHLVLAVDTTIASPSSDRVKFYVNGVQVTTFSTATDPGLSAQCAHFNTTSTHYLGKFIDIARYFPGYLADIHFIDGQALDPSSFTEFDDNGVLQPKAYSGTYGTNGFHLPFSDNSTAAALGTDTSSNGNTWTVNNLSVTAGAGNDSLVDSPTNGSQVDTGVGGEVVGNYATLNPLSAIATLTNGNLDVNSTISSAQASIGVVNGKWYCEVTLGSIVANSFIGFSNSSSSIVSGPYVLYGINGYGIAVSGYSYSSTLSGTGTLGDVIGIALDCDSGSLTLYKNNISLGSVTGFTISSPVFIGCRTNSSVSTAWNWNFGQRPFAYTAPSGFKALCTTNLPEPTIADGSTAMDVLTWTGTGGDRSLTNLNFSPDLVWGKSRSNAYGNLLYDIVRGGGSAKDLSSNYTAAEGSATTDTAQYGYLNTFDSNGFSVKKGSNSTSLGDAGFNQSGVTYVAWTWDAGSSTVTNTQGSITSQVRANASAGFSIVTWTGNGTAGATVGHGLGAKPFLRIIKRRDAASTIGWMTFHESAPSSYFTLNSTNAATPASEAAPTSTVFSLPADANSNASGGTYIAYCFAPVAGYSSAFTYNANGSNDGPMVYLGFRPRFILLKSTNISGTEWMMWDAARGDYNVVNPYLLANRSNAEGSTGAIDFLSNGFKLRSISDSWNNSGATGTYVGFAWAESPFQYARAR